MLVLGNSDGDSGSQDSRGAPKKDMIFKKKKAKAVFKRLGFFQFG